MVLIVLPALNEAIGLPCLLESIRARLDQAGLAYLVIVVDDGSTDRTATIARGLASTMPVMVLGHPTNRGLAAAVRTGLMAALERAQEDDIVVTMDADNSQDPTTMPLMVRMVRDGRDVVIASRFQPGGRMVGVPWYRRLLSIGARLLLTVMFPVQGVRDYTCGYRAYKIAALRGLVTSQGEAFVSETGFSVMLDLLLQLRQAGAVFAEVPLVLRYDLKAGKSKMRVGRTIRQTLGLVLRRRLGLR